MSLLVDKRVVVHQIPKTGSAIIWQFLQDNNVRLSRVGDCVGAVAKIVSPNVALHNWCDVKLPSFMIARDPVDWWGSWYQFRKSKNWGSNRDCVAERCCADTFDEFVMRLAKHFPGLYSKIMKQFAEASTHIGRFETLEYDTVGFLRDHGFEVNTPFPHVHKQERESVGEKTAALIRDIESDYYKWEKSL